MFKLEKIRAVARTKTTLGSHSLIYTSKALCPHKKTFVYVDFNLRETDKIWTNQSIKKSKIHGTQYQGNRCTRFLLFLISRCKAVSSTGARLLRFLWSKENESWAVTKGMSASRGFGRLRCSQPYLRETDKLFPPFKVMTSRLKQSNLLILQAHPPLEQRPLLSVYLRFKETKEYGTRTRI